MSVLRAIERSIEGLFEGVFGRAFRTHVQPVEIARKLAKEMDEHRSVSVSRVYAPNEYTVYLSVRDRAQFASYEGSLIGELQEYLMEHARRESYALLRAGGRLVVYGASSVSTGNTRDLFAAAKMWVTTPSYGALPLMQESKSVCGVNLLKLWDDQGHLERVAKPITKPTTKALR